MKLVKKSTRIKKTKARVIQKAKGKGPNININIDQSKRGQKESQQRAPPSIISTSTPQFIPQYIPMFNQPAPPSNPIQQAIQNMAPVPQPVPNELERPKPIIEDKPISTINNIPIAEAIPFIESFPVKEELPIVKAIMTKPPTKSVQLVESFPADEEKPQVNKFKILPYTPKPVAISTQTDLLPDAQLIPMRRRRSSDTQTDDIITNVFGTQTENPITASLGTNTETRDTTPLEEQAKQESPEIMTVFKSPEKKKIGTMTELIQQREFGPEPPPKKMEVKPEFRKFFESQRLGGPDSTFERLSREEMQRRREEAMNKDKPKPLLLEAQESPTIESLLTGMTPEQIEKMKEETAKYRKAEGEPKEAEEGFKTAEMTKEEKKAQRYDEYLKSFNRQGLMREANKRKIPYEEYKSLNTQQLSELLRSKPLPRKYKFG